MKKLLLLFMIIGLLTNTSHAQGTYEFAANLILIEPPPFPVSHIGQGLFTLEGNALSYRVAATPYAPEWWQSSQILGGPEGPVLFDLRFGGCQPPLNGNLGYCVFRGTVEVPSQLIPDLIANRWYVHVVDSSPYNLSIRGQIQLVPEPSTLTFIGFAGGLTALRALRLGLRTL